MKKDHGICKPRLSGADLPARVSRLLGSALFGGLILPGKQIVLYNHTMCRSQPVDDSSTATEPEAETLVFDPHSSVPAYVQIVDGLRRHLVTGRFAAGERLPPVRHLARDLGIHHNTVAEAYRRLASEGWLRLVRGRGATVLQRPMPKAADADLVALEGRLDGWLAEALAAGAPKDWLIERLAARVARLDVKPENEETI